MFCFLAVLAFVSGDSLAQPLKLSGHLFFIVLSMELVFWWLCRGQSRFGFVGLRCCHACCVLVLSSIDLHVSSPGRLPDEAHADAEEDGGRYASDCAAAGRMHKTARV